MENHKTTDQGLLKKIWSLLKQQSRKITFMAAIMFVFGAIEVYYDIKDHQEKPDTGVNVNNDELLKDSVLSRIDYIEKNFDKEKIPAKLDAKKEYSIIRIKNFKYISLEYANYLKESLESPQFSALQNLSVDELIEINNTDYEKEKNAWHLRDSIISIMNELNAYGEVFKVNSYLLNQAIYSDLIISSEKVENLRLKYYSDSDYYLTVMDAKAATSGELYYEGSKKDLLRVLMLQDRFFSDSTYLSFQDKFLKFLITQNRNYSVPLKKYLSGYKNE